MEPEKLSPAFVRKRKFLMALPVLVTPFIVALFILSGGGKGNTVQAESSKPSGINTRLPDAHFKKGKEKDKLLLYEMAARDSMKIKEAIKNDPYYSKDSIRKGRDTSSNHDLESIFKHSFADHESRLLSNHINPLNGKIQGDSAADQITKKLGELNSIIHQKRAKPPPFPLDAKPPYGTENQDMSRLRSMLSEAKSGSSSPDPEMKQLDEMLNKIIAIQNPEKNEESARPHSERQQNSRHIQFDSNANAITAVIPGKQTLVSGATIRIRLTEPVTIDSIIIPADEFIYGTVALGNERLKILIRSLRAGNNIIPINLSVYDLDGIEGIYIPGSITRDASKQSLDQGVGELGLTTLDPSIGAQAAGAGIQAAKSLLSHKIKLVSVTIPEGYQILLKENN